MVVRFFYESREFRVEYFARGGKMFSRFVLCVLMDGENGFVKVIISSVYYVGCMFVDCIDMVGVWEMILDILIFIKLIRINFYLFLIFKMLSSFCGNCSNIVVIFVLIDVCLIFSFVDFLNFFLFCECV